MRSRVNFLNNQMILHLKIEFAIKNGSISSIPAMRLDKLKKKIININKLCVRWNYKLSQSYLNNIFPQILSLMCRILLQKTPITL